MACVAERLADNPVHGRRRRRSMNKTTNTTQKAAHQAGRQAGRLCILYSIFHLKRTSGKSGFKTTKWDAEATHQTGRDDPKVKPDRPNDPFEGGERGEGETL